jgi:serine protease
MKLVRSWRTISTVCAAGGLASALAVSAGNSPAAAALSPRRIYPTVEAAEQRRADAPTTRAKTNPQLTYHGGPVGVTAGRPQVYLVFWGSQWGAETPTGSSHFANDSLGVAPRLQALFDGIGTNAERWSGVMTQYCDGPASGSTFCAAAAPHVGYPGGGVLAGIWADTAAPVPQAASYSQIADEAVRAAAHFGNVTLGSSRYAQYVIAFPRGTQPDGFNNGGGFCAYHGTVDDTSGPIAFTNLPYIPDMGKSCGQNFVNAGTVGLLDGVTMVEGHEYAETITDQDIGAGWTDEDGFENADKCVWMSSGPGAAGNVTFSTGTFAMQTTWSNDDASCAMTHPIFGLDAQPDDFALTLNPSSASVQPGESIDVAVDAFTTSGPSQTVTVALGPVSADIGATLSDTAIDTDGSVTLSITTAPSTPYGVYRVAIAATGSTTHTATFSLSVTPPPLPIENGVEVTGLSGVVDSNAYYTIDVPASATNFDVTTGDGTGDADLYVQKGAIPTDTNYLCRSRGRATNEHCFLFRPEGTWYLRIVGADTFSNVSLKATYANVSRLLPGQRLTNLEDVAGSQRFYWIPVPPGRHVVTAHIGGMTGDADLYMQEGALPSRLFNICTKPPKHGRRPESCRYRFTWDVPFTSYWYVGVYGIADYTKLRLTVTAP